MVISIRPFDASLIDSAHGSIPSTCRGCDPGTQCDKVSSTSAAWAPCAVPRAIAIAETSRVYISPPICEHHSLLVPHASPQSLPPGYQHRTAAVTRVSKHRGKVKAEYGITGGGKNNPSSSQAFTVS